MDHLALVTNLFSRLPVLSCCVAPHWPPEGGRYKTLPLLIPVHDPAARQIVRRKLHRHFIARENPDEILAHLPGDMRQHPVLVLQFHAEHRVRQRLNHRRHYFNGILLRISGVALLFSCKAAWPYAPVFQVLSNKF